jgi:hypothetical protein
MNMKRIFKYTVISVLPILFLTMSCTEDWEDMNKSPNALSEPDASGMLAYSIRYYSDYYYDAWMTMNNFCTYAGHLGKIQYIDESRYEYRGSTVNMAWSDAYRVLKNLQEVKKAAIKAGNKNQEAVAMTLQAYVWQIATDMWKAIPFSDALNGEEDELTPAYDNQEDIYLALLDMLETANSTYNLGPSGKPIGTGDLLLNGDLAKWQKFTNSLHLRVAMRASGAPDPLGSEAQTDITTMLGDPSTYPMMASNDDNVLLKWQGLSPYAEPWYTDKYIDGRDDHGMGKPLIDTMKNWNDPRLPVYAKPNQSAGEYNGVVPGVSSAPTLADISRIGSKFRDQADGNTYWMRYFEVCFLIAEAAQNGWGSGNFADAQAAYEAGVEASLSEHGIPPGQISTYLAEPAVNWGSGVLTNYEKIMLQKWIGLFKQGHEAWSEVRRTDIPVRPEAPGSPYGTHDRCPFRYPYPTDEFNLNSEEINKVADGIVDHFWGQQMVWDTRTGIQ